MNFENIIPYSIYYFINSYRNHDSYILQSGTPIGTKYHEMRGPPVLDNQVITRGTIVEIMATKCDGIPECLYGTDEKYCGFSGFLTLFMGNLCCTYLQNSYFLKFLEGISLISSKSRMNNTENYTSFLNQHLIEVEQLKFFQGQ